MPSPQTPHPVPQPLRDQLLVELTSRPLSGATSDQRYAVRRIAADAFALGFNDGRVTQQQFEAIERDLAPAPAVHRWQTIRLVDAGPVQTLADDPSMIGLSGTVEARCSCGTGARLDFNSGGLALPPCPEEDR